MINSSSAKRKGCSAVLRCVSVAYVHARAQITQTKNKKPKSHKTRIKWKKDKKMKMLRMTGGDPARDLKHNFIGLNTIEKFESMSLCLMKL